MPKGYRRDGTCLGGKNGTAAAREHQEQHKFRDDPELVATILDLYMTKGWSAQAVVNKLQDPRVRKNTVYFLARRARKMMEKAAPGSGQKFAKRISNVPIAATDDVTASVEVVDGAVIVPDDRPDVVLQKARAYLREHVSTAKQLSDKVLKRTLTSADDAPAADVDTLLRASGRAIDLVRRLSGIEAEERASSGAGSGSKHLHLHLGSNGGFAPADNA